MFDVDFFVIGGGSGGVRAARIAAAEGGARVALAEASRVGGTCVIRGCVPKKLMVFASGYPEAIADARAYGWEAASGGFDWAAFRARLGAELDRLEAAYRATLARAGVEVHDQRATLVDAHTVALEDGRRISARHILIATGGRPFVPEVPGAELAIISDAVFDLPALPGRIVIVGSGYIACEFASIFAGLGARVAQVFRAPHILRGFDAEARAHLEGAMAGQGIALHPGAEVVRIEADGADGAARIVHLTDGTRLEADVVLYATGRRPNTAGLGLEALGVGIASSGAVEVDGYSQTAVPSIFAVGDVTDRVNLTPAAIREGQALAQTLFLARPTRADHPLVPSAVFTRPEFGTVGLSEEDARARGPVEVYVATFRPMRSLFAGREDRALFKLVVDAASRRVLGCHIVAPEAGEMIQLAAVAIGMGATKEDFDRTLAVHPTMAEELVTMKTPARRG
ncbi:MAG: glutathione-disulfide reductase [Gemmobacter sp.]